MPDVVRHDSETSSQSGRSDQNVLYTDGRPGITKMGQQIPRQNRFLETNCQNRNPGQHLLLDSSPKASSIPKSGRAVS